MMHANLSLLITIYFLADCGDAEGTLQRIAEYSSSIVYNGGRRK